jgi:hypothetical protein
MILTFSKEQFVQRILEGTKIHTIREDKHDRWKPGMKIHFWKGNPRNVKANPYQFALGEVEKVQTIEIVWTDIVVKDFKGRFPHISVDGKPLSTDIGNDEYDKLAVNDGFSDWKGFGLWFKEDFTGKIIHWKQPVEVTLPIHPVYGVQRPVDGEFPALS